MEVLELLGTDDVVVAESGTLVVGGDVASAPVVRVVVVSTAGSGADGVVDEESTATITGAGSSPTRSSAAATICQAITVVTAVTASHARRSRIPLTIRFSRLGDSDSSTEHHDFLKVEPVQTCRGYALRMPSIVLIEDDVDIRHLVADTLSSEGFDVETADRALPGLELAVKGNPDLVLLDLGLPDLDGSELLRMIRAVSTVPIIVITARGADSDVVSTLDAGADDYLTKPFSVAQLLARVRAVLRRRAPDGTGQTIKVGGLVIDPSAREVRLDGIEIELSPKEFDLLRVLADREGEVVSKRELLAEVWREPYGGSDRTIDVHLSWLRKKLGESSSEPRYLRTVHGVGVKLVDPTT